MPLISQLPDASFPLNGNELLPFDQDSIGLTGASTVTVKAKIKDILGSSSMTFHGACTLRSLTSVITTDGTKNLYHSGFEFDTDSFFAYPAPSGGGYVPFDGIYQLGLWYEWEQTFPTAGADYELTIESEFHSQLASTSVQPSETVPFLNGTVVSVLQFLNGGEQFWATMNGAGDDTSLYSRLWIQLLGPPQSPYVPPPPVPPVPPVPPTPTLFDQFVDVDGTPLPSHVMDIGPGWTDLNGGWTIQSDQAVNSTVAGGQNLTVSDCGSGDCTAQLTAVPSSTYDFGLVFNAVDASNYWFANPYLGGGMLRVWQVLGGGFTLIDSQALTLPTLTPCTLEVVTSGDAVSVSVNGSLLSDTTTTTRPLSSATLTGLRSTAAEGTTFGPFTVYT